jgi:hypothetical protein
MRRVNRPGIKPKPASGMRKAIQDTTLQAKFRNFEVLGFALVIPLSFKRM